MKFTIKAITWVSVILLSGIVMLAGLKASAEPINLLTGSWICTEGTFDNSGESFPPCEYTFRSDGRYTYRDDCIPYLEYGNYRLESHILTLIRDDGGQEQYFIAIHGNTLSWEDETDRQLFSRDFPVPARAAAEHLSGLK